MPDRNYVIVVTWTEPEDGICAYGMFGSEEEGNNAIPTVQEDFLNDGELPDDVVFKVVQLSSPYVVRRA